MTKQLTLRERVFIEKSLEKDYTFATIARNLNRSPSTIAREIKRHRVFVERFHTVGENDCVLYTKCLRNKLCEDAPVSGCYVYRCKKCPEHNCMEICPSYASKHCSKLDKPPYVCTCCDQQNSCRKNHAYYTAHRADSEHRKTMRDSHRGIRIPPEELIRIGELITPLIRRGQSLNHICASHADEIGVSERTLYNYIAANAFAVRNIDLPRKVRYRRRKEPKVLTKMEYVYRRGRSYEDFKNYMVDSSSTGYVEMDTVKSARGSKKTLLTFIFTESDFMLIFLMKDGTEESVLNVFDMLTERLGLALFRRLFPVILTDNGVEFKDPGSLEFSKNNARRTRIFYCDPNSSWQKPHVENNHALIRRILPKGTSFMPLTHDDVTLVTCHINSVIREQFGNMTPFQKMVSEDEKKLLSSLNLSSLPPDDVFLKPALLKR